MGQKRGRRPGRITVHADTLSLDRTANVVPPQGTVQQIVSITTESNASRYGPAVNIQFKITDGTHAGVLGNGTYPSRTYYGHRGGAVITDENYLSLCFCASAYSGEGDTATYNVVLMEV